MDWRLAALALGNFVAGTGSLMLPGMLNEVSAELGRPAQDLGLLLATSQMAGGIAAPFVAFATSRIDRRTMLVATALIAALSHFAMVWASALAALILARAVTGITGSALTPQVAASAGLLVPPERRGSALAIGLLGYNMASVLGVPAGVALASAFGFRTSFLIMGVLSLVMALLMRQAVPANLPRSPLDLDAWRALASNRAIVMALGFYFLHFVAQFTWFAYIAPLLREAFGATAKEIALLLAWFGICGLCAALVSARFIDRVGSRYLSRQCVALMLAAMLLWPLSGDSFYGAAIVIMLFAVGSFPLGGAQQSFLVSANPRLATASVALNSSVSLLGAAMGALLGAQLIAWAGYPWLTWVSAGILVAAFGVLLLAQGREADHA